MTNQASHQNNLEMRLEEVRGLLATINDEDVLETHRTATIMASLSGIEQLVEQARREFSALAGEIHQMKQLAQ